MSILKSSLDSSDNMLQISVIIFIVPCPSVIRFGSIKGFEWIEEPTVKAHWIPRESDAVISTKCYDAADVDHSV